MNVLTTNSKARVCVCVCVCAYPTTPRPPAYLPISGVNPRSLPGVVVDIKHSPVVIPGFLPARGQRQLRVLSPLTAADPRHSVETVSQAEAPPALLFFFYLPPPHPRKKESRRSSLHYKATPPRCDGEKTRKNMKFPPRFSAETVPREKHLLSPPTSPLKTDQRRSRGPPCSPLPPYLIPSCPYFGGGFA